MTSRQCSKCLLTKPIDEFSKGQSRCKKCKAAATRAWYANQTPEARERHLQTRRDFAKSAKGKRVRKNIQLRCRFDIGLCDYERMLAEQNGVCAICLQPERSKQNGRIIDLAVDHDHKTGRVRQLLCMTCNQMLGAINDNQELLQKAIDYLRRHAASVRLESE